MNGRVFNFSPGPAMLPTEVLAQVRDELLDWHGRGASIMEMSHRGPDFMGVIEQAERDLRELLALSADYRVLFLQGGAATQFAAVPMNLLGGRDRADYVNTGEWSTRAIREARKLCTVNVAATSEPAGFSYAPKQADWRLDPQRGLRPLLSKRNHPWRRVPLDAGDGRRAPGRGHVLQHPFASH